MSSTSKAKTIIERFGFKDEDLTTSEHDEILIKLLDKQVCQEMLKKLNILLPLKAQISFYCTHNQSSYYSTERCEYTQKQCDFTWEKYLCERMKKENKKYPKPLQEFHEESLSKIYLFKKSMKWMDIKAEYPIMSGHYNVGFADIKIEIRYEDFSFDCDFDALDLPRLRIITNFKPIDIFVEIKPKIRSVGELIRQISFYRSHTDSSAIWIVVTNDVSIAPILATQNILTYSIIEEGKTK